jgi:transposase-like protein
LYLEIPSFREVIGAVEGTREDEKGWALFLRHLKERGL